MINLKIAEIASFAEPDSTICAEHRCQLAAAYVDCEHFLAAALQQHLGETAGGRTTVEGPPSHCELEVIKSTDELVCPTRDVMIGRSANVRRWRHLIARPLGNRAVDDDVTCLDHRLGVRTRSGQAAPHQLPIEALSHSSAGRGAVGRAVIFSIQCLLQVLLSFREPIMMLGKRRGREVCEPDQRIVDRIVASLWRAD